ncbi:MAG: hypothetical protein M1812_006690 [Candelaria pacifica]|nr:MAG: hypothetical protein M1812_006690 [Candelaria pacifica]
MSSPPAPPRRFAPQPVETTIKTRRKFAPEPVETTIKSNRGKPAETSPPKSSTTRSKYSPQPIEISTNSNRSKPPSKPSEPPPEAPRSRHLPEPIETTTRSSRRKFAPQLIETTKRSRKSGDAAPAELAKDSKEDFPKEKVSSPRSIDKRRKPVISPMPPENTPISNAIDIHQFFEPQRKLSMRPHTNTRQHSFLAPSLETIASSESDGSDNSRCPSLSTSPSVSSEGGSESHKNKSRMRESCDDRFSGYLLALAAKAAEKQLKDQAMSAYANDDYHEPVDHFGMDRDSEESGEEMDVTVLPRDVDGDIEMRRDSAADLGWEFQEMRRHQERLERQKESQWLEQAKTRRRSSVKGPISNVDGAAHATDVSGAPKHIIGGWQKNIGLQPMRSAANPPMLGGDIAFPICASPDHTKLDLGHYPFPRQGSQSSINSETPRLWNAADYHASCDDGAGLWKGFCIGGDDTPLAPPSLASGLKTPAEPANPFENLESNPKFFITPEDMVSEFNDSFVTQVYNYLSLGYPSLARRYDIELSKITQIPITELSRDDKLADAKGFIGLDEEYDIDIQEESQGENSGKCARWKALKKYVSEWARQCPKATSGLEIGGKVVVDGWGERIRRGSWAL